MASSVKFSGALYQDRHTFQIQGNLTDEARYKLLEVAEMYNTSIREAIASDGFGSWDMDTLWYDKKKAKMRQTDKRAAGTAYVQTGALLTHLKTEITQDGASRMRVWAGFDNGKHYSGYSVSELVEKLDANRPLISLAWERVKPQAMEILRTIGAGALRMGR